MGKNRKQATKETVTQAPRPAAETASPEVVATALSASAPSLSEPTPVSPSSPLPARPKSLLRRLWPDLIKVGLAFAVIGLGVAIWFKPPLIRASSPYVSYRFAGQTHTDAVLYRPLAMPTRYYIQLPRQLAGRYTWFAVDRRREVAALTEAPSHLFLGQSAIKRSDPLGLDLEFRKLDHSEWQVHFFDDAVIFSNAVLSVRMDATKSNSHASK